MGKGAGQHSGQHAGTHPQRQALRENGSGAVHMLKGNDIPHTTVNMTGVLGKDLEFACANGYQEGAACELL